MESFATIDMNSLVTVCGGEGAPNTIEGSGNIGVTAPTQKGDKIQVGVQGSYKQSQTNYAVCVDSYRQMGGTVDGLRAACGLPNGQP